MGSPWGGRVQDAAGAPPEITGGRYGGVSTSHLVCYGEGNPTWWTDFREGSKGCGEVDFALPDGLPYLGKPRPDRLGRQGTRSHRSALDSPFPGPLLR